MEIDNDCITNELRQYATSDSLHYCSDYLAIADRIDEEHESACAEAYGNGVKSVTLPDMTAYIKLPVDADGKPIHFGDVMQMVGDSELREVEGFYGGGFLAWRNGRFVPCAAGLYRHHEPDTWEHIIYDAMQAGRTEEAVDVTPIIERCKALAEKEMS